MTGKRPQSRYASTRRVDTFPVDSKHSASARAADTCPPPTRECTNSTRLGGASTVTARARLDASAYFAFQRLRLQLELGVAPGWHVYGPEVPPGYTGLSVDASSAPEGVQLGPVVWPKTDPLYVAGLEEDFAVYAGDEMGPQEIFRGTITGLEAYFPSEAAPELGRGYLGEPAPRFEIGPSRRA